MEHQTDGALLEQIGRERCREAFQLLYQRFERPMYNLGLRILGNPQGAEEACQIAWQHIWRYASAFRAGYEVRPWLFRILVNACRRLAGRQKRACRSAPEVDFQALPGRTPSGELDLEKAESLCQLKVALERLPAASRQIVVLHYGAGMSLLEIGRVLAIPNRTVYHKLDGALAALRTQLTQAGFSLALPALTRALLEEVPAPGDLAARVQKQLPPAPHPQATLVPRRTGGGAAWRKGTFRATWVRALCLALPVLAFAVAWSPRGQAKAGAGAEVPKRLAAESETRGRPEGESPTALRRREWTFQEGIPAELVNPGGRFAWAPPGNGVPGSAVAPADLPGLFLLPIWRSERPFCVRYWSGWRKDARDPAIGTFYCDGRRVPPRQTWSIKLSMAFAYPITTWFLNERALTKTEQHGHSAYSEFPRMPSFEYLAFFGRGIAVTRIELFEVEPSQLPPEILDPQSLKAGCPRSLVRPNWRTIEEVLELPAAGAFDSAAAGR